MKAGPPRHGGSGSGQSRYQYDTPITWLRKAIGEWNRYPLADEGVGARTVFVDTRGISSLISG